MKHHDERLLALVGCIRGIVLEFDEAARYVSAWADDPMLLAAPADALIGRTIDEVLGDAGAPFTAMVKRVFATGVVEHLEYPLELPGGRRWFFADIKRVGTGSTGMTVVFFARDITDRRATEEELARNQERYDLAARATNDVLWDWNILTDQVTWNIAVTTVLGYPEPGSGVAWWKDGIHPEERAGVVARITTALNGDAESWSDRYRFRRADGTYGDFVDRGLIVRSADRSAVRMVGSMTEVTQINRLQAQLLKADRYAALGTLAEGAAHEINNPLCYLMANVEAGLETLDEPEPSRDVLRTLMSESLDGIKRIAAIVKSLRMFTRTNETVANAVDVHTILDAAIRMAAAQIRPRARLVQVFEGSPRVRANEAQLAQVFLNLLLNAAQSINTGNAFENEIRVITTEADGCVAISVVDSGEGIPAANLPRVFDPFFTTRPVGVGTGLGLSICHGIVESHDGRITVSSEPGRGTTFTVRLPAAATPPSSVARMA